MDTRDKVTVIHSWLDDFKHIDPKRIDQIQEFIAVLYRENGKVGGLNVRLQDQISEKDERIKELEGLLKFVLSLNKKGFSITPKVREGIEQALKD